ncbi:hypothetical protein FG877_10610 [Enterococcus casseliflavus]|nr:hypothetical protein [Enterococcus casseliflavus]
MNILSDKDYQLFRLINILYFNGPTSLKALESELKSSSAKLVSSISVLNDMLSPCKISNQNNILYLSIPNNASYDFCVSKLLASSLECSIVESFLFEKHNTYLSLAEHLHVSESTVKRSIRRLNSHFRPHDMVLKTKPLRIEGDERNIRYFFILYFSAKYNLKNIPFDKSTISQLEQFYNLGARLFKKTISVQDRSNFTLFTSVAYEREKNGHNIAGTESFKIKFLLNIINSLPKKITKLDKIASKNDLKIWIGTFSIFTNNNTLFLAHFNSEKEHFEQKGITQFISIFCTVFKIELTEKIFSSISKEIYEILFGFLKPRNTMEPINNHYKNFYRFNDFFMDSYKCLTKDIFCNCFPTHLHPYFDFVFFVITTKFPNLLDNFFSLFAKVTITVYTDFDFEFSNYVKSKLEKIIPGTIKIITIDSFDSLHGSNIISATDLFITNVYNNEYLGISNEKLYIISRHLSTADIENITNMVREVYKKNYDYIILEGEKILSKNFKSRI